MGDARERAEEALALDYPTSIALRGVPATIRFYADALRALLAETEPARDGFDPACPRCQRPLSDHHPNRNNDPVCADFPSAPATDAATLETLAVEINEWAAVTFPVRTAASIAEHLRREANELADDPLDSEEMADVFILLANLWKFTGTDLVGAVSAKLAKNRTRTWGKPDAHGVVEHIREPAPAPDAAVREAPVCLECGFASGGHVHVVRDEGEEAVRYPTPEEWNAALRSALAPAHAKPDAVREAESRYATDPDRGDNGVPYCSEQCPQHDGKRCRIMGVRPSSICEPEVLNLLAALAAQGQQ